METRVAVIAGPTCSGKTKLGINLALKLNTEIISADSRQVYKYLNIGTAKPTIKQRERVVHHLIDFVEPNEKFNASIFEKQAAKLISDLHENGRIPIVVGGSGLYIKALVDGMIEDIEVDEEYRNELLEQRRQKGNEFLFEKLKKVDPESAEKMLPQNWKRVIRALEVHHATGHSISKLFSSQIKKHNFIFYQFALTWERSKLYENINKRVDEMIHNGLVEEVKSILSMGYNKNLNALNSVGYKEIISYLDGEIDLKIAVELIKRNTRRFAKRQMTWFNSDKRIKWLHVDSHEKLLANLQPIINSVKTN